MTQERSDSTEHSHISLQLLELVVESPPEEKLRFVSLQQIIILLFDGLHFDFLVLHIQDLLELSIKLLESFHELLTHLNLIDGDCQVFLQVVRKVFNPYRTEHVPQSRLHFSQLAIILFALFQEFLLLVQLKLVAVDRKLSHLLLHLLHSTLIALSLLLKRLVVPLINSE